MKSYKQFVAGMLAGAFVFGSVPALAETKKLVTAIFGQAKLVVNGEKVDKETVIIDGITYVPLRAIGEMLNLDVYWDERTSTAKLTQKTMEKLPIESNKPKIDQIRYDINVVQYDEYGNMTIDMVYINDSDYPITYFSLSLLNKKNNERIYLSSDDTVLPGEISPKIYYYTDQSMDLKNLEKLKTHVTYVQPDGTRRAITYDYKLKTYE